MGIPRLAQVRLLHMAILGMGTATCFFYIAHVTSPRLARTTSSLQTLISTTFQDNIVQGKVAKNNNLSKVPHLQQQLRTSIGKNLKLTNSSQLDITRGIPTEIIYEAGHIDVSCQVCPDLGKYIKLLIVITSAPSNESARMAIRQTWGHFSIRKDVAVAFILGSISNKTVNANIEKEQYLYGDLIRGKFIDTYDNLTLKTISLLEWVANYCSKAAFVLKTDDDMFINVSRLLAFIAQRNPEQRAIYGRLAKKWKPRRSKKSKYYVSPYQYEPAFYPDFTTGPAYLIPARLSKELFMAALNHAYFKLEDVFVTGVVANGLKIERVHVPEFRNKRLSLTACSVQLVISIHKIRGVEQYDLWKKLHDVTAKCKK